MRSMMRSTAEAHGQDTIVQKNDTLYKWKRDPLIAEAMVDERVAIPNLIRHRKSPYFHSTGGSKVGILQRYSRKSDEVITQYLGYKDYKMKSYIPSWQDDLKGFLMNPIFQSILIIIIIGGIYFEMQTPGLGFPSAASLLAAILYFAPLYIDGLAANWEILVLSSAFLLLAVESSSIPGFRGCRN